MKKKSDNKIEIGKIEGNVVISQDQKGGTTSHSISNKNSNRKRIWTISSVIFLAAAIVTILAYFKIYIPSNTKLSNQKEVKSSQSVVDTIKKGDSLKKSPKLKKEKQMNNKKDEKPINIGKVEGDVVISQNQSGGITAHSVNINEPLPPEWNLGTSEKINESEWRTKLSARENGNLAFYNWNLLFTFNTSVIKREDVPGEVTVGPWMPLEIKGGSLSPNQFFIGFSEFKPGQGFSIYLYSKEPIKIIKVVSLSK